MKSECWPPLPKPGPVMVRITIGTEVCPPDMKRSLAAWLTIMSEQTVMKFISMISTTGLKPIIAAPMAAPVKAVSEIGVETTRSLPYLLDSPRVTPTTPPPV
jgi:hypothetical protein